MKSIGLWKWQRRSWLRLKAELAKAESDVQSKQAIVSRVAGELENAQKSVDVKVTGFPGWRDVHR